MLGDFGLGSLRVRLPALFLLGIVLAGMIAAAISVRFFQSYTRSRAIAELRSEGVGIVQLYARQAAAGQVPVENLERAIGGDRIFYVPIAPGAELFVGHLDTLDPGVVDVKALEKHGPQTMTLTYAHKKYLAVARPVKLGSQLFGAMVVAKPVSQLRSRLLALIEQLAIAFGGGIVVVGLLGVY